MLVPNLFITTYNDKEYFSIREHYVMTYAR